MVLFAPSERGTSESATAYRASIGGAEANCASNLGQDYFAYTLREPVGVVGQIIPIR